MNKLLIMSTLSLGLGITSTAFAKAQTHDGFHLQLSGGIGTYSSSADVLNVEQKYSGVTFPAQLFMGGTIKGVAVGGGLILDTAPSPSFEQNGQKASGLDFKQYVVGLGVYGDYYLPIDGVHVQAFFGWGGLETSSQGNVGGSDPTGMVISLGGGYDFWLTEELSAGVLARLVYAPLSLNDVGFTTISPALMAALTWH